TQPRPRAPSADRLPRPWHWSFRAVDVGSYNAAQLDAFAERTERPAPPPPGITLILARYHRLSALVLDPVPAARRLAKRIHAMRAARRVPLVTLPMRRTHRLPAELGLMASFLPREVNDAMFAFFDTG
ncbi:MAG: hypothetical protein WA989_12305, partial [Henriciella sp.]|uniref:hypothetical protein n=1 Tax=Henriciella sp. TaxID=1968823 RepID=UPI003C765E77